MKCPYCRSISNEVYNSRTTKFGNQIWRRRRCADCGKPFTTYESADLGFLKVNWGSPRTEKYSRPKLYASLSAVFPPKHDESVVDDITATIEAKLLDLQRLELSTKDIAKCVLTTLKAYDKAAFLRYLADHTELTSASKLKQQLREY